MKVIVLLIVLGLFIGCVSESNIVTRNLSKAADEFEIVRKVTFYNGITDKCILTIEGRCSVNFYSNKFIVIVKTGHNEYKKHYLGRADNVFPIIEQLETAEVNSYKYKMIIRPSALIPDVDLKN